MIELEKPCDSIDILKGYLMRAEGKQWTLYKRTLVTPKDPKEQQYYEWKPIGFYSFLSQLFIRVTDEELKSCKSMDEILGRLKELQKYFEEKLEVDL